MCQWVTSREHPCPVEPYISKGYLYTPLIKIHLPCTKCGHSDNLVYICYRVLHIASGKQWTERGCQLNGSNIPDYGADVDFDD